MKVGTDIQRGKIWSEVVGGGRSDRENNVRTTNRDGYLALDAADAAITNAGDALALN